MIASPAAAGPPPRLPRLALAVLVVLLVAHAAGAVWVFAHAGEGALAERDTADFLIVTGATLAVATLLFWRWPTRVRAIAALAAAITAAILFTPGAATIVALMMLNAFVTGSAVLRTVGQASRGRADPPASVVTLVGTALWIGVISATLSLHVHFQATYVLMLALPLVAFPRLTMDSLAKAGRWLAARERFEPRECVWIALIAALGMVHALLAARPEVGHDALAVHLQFAEMLGHDHQWRFDVGRYAWAAMPLGADAQYAAAYLLDGERAARLLNVVFGGLLGAVTYRLLLLQASREVAFACLALFASAPIAFLETSSLFVENLWTAFLVGSLYASLSWARTQSSGNWVAALLCAAGAMQCKAIGALWLLPALAWLAVLSWRRNGAITRTMIAWGAIAFLIAIWPYANAWLRTGNPMFPFLNGVFRSPLFDTSSSFNNPLYNAPLRPWSIYALVVDGSHHIEGRDGAAGLHWLVFYPLVLMGMLRRPGREFWWVLALAALFFAGVYSQQSYLRYLLPWFALVTVLAGWSVAALPGGRVAGGAVLVIGAIVCALHLTIVYTASWINTTLCFRCTYDQDARERYVTYFAPTRAIGLRLNRELPQARVGFMVVNGPSPSGYVGYSRAANWHDWFTYVALTGAASATDVDAIARRHGLTHVVFASVTPENENPAIRAWLQSATMPLWSVGAFSVAAVREARR